MKKQYLLTTLLVAFFVVFAVGGVHTALAQGTGASISGDEVCGGLGNPCNLSHLKIIAQGILKTIVSLGLPLLVVFIVYRFVLAWFYLRQGNSNAYREALKKSAQALAGFLIIVGVFGGVLYIMLKFLGVKDSPLKIFNIIGAISMSLVPHAHAATIISEPMYPVSLYKFIVAVIHIAMRFFIYPALLIMWVGSALVFVNAKGTLEGVKKARLWLRRVSLITLAVLVVQGTLFVLQILGNIASPETSVFSYLINLNVQRFLSIDIVSVISMSLVPHAHAATGQLLPNFLGVDDLYSFILAVLRLVMRFFVYPALIVMWVWSGFAFVTAQGNPEGLKKARSWLLWAVVTTLVVFMIQGFLLAVQGSVKKILPGSSQSHNTSKSLVVAQ